MFIRKRVSLSNRQIDVVLKSADGTKAAGKFLFGRSKLENTIFMLVFDDEARWHKDIAASHLIHPLGGGWCDIDHLSRTIKISSSSQAFGREPDRELTAQCMRESLAGYVCQVLD